MEENFFDPELFWESILSRDEMLIRSAYKTLNIEEKTAVISHLQRMVSEPGWHPEQCASALAALGTLQQDV
jgi:hypothetical protein